MCNLVLLLLIILSIFYGNASLIRFLSESTFLSTHVEVFSLDQSPNLALTLACFDSWN